MTSRADPRPLAASAWRSPNVVSVARAFVAEPADRPVRRSTSATVGRVPRISASAVPITDGVQRAGRPTFGSSRPVREMSRPGSAISAAPDSSIQPTRASAAAERAPGDIRRATRTSGLLPALARAARASRSQPSPIHSAVKHPAPTSTLIRSSSRAARSTGVPAGRTARIACSTRSAVGVLTTMTRTILHQLIILTFKLRICQG